MGYDVKTIFCSSHTLGHSLVRVKDGLQDGQRSMVVYQVPCSCGKVYVGETKRALAIRIKEHQDAVRLQHTSKSAIVEHAWELGHRINWEGDKILDSVSSMSELSPSHQNCFT